LLVKWTKALKRRERKAEDMQGVAKPKAPGVRQSGWLVKASQGYYTGNGRSALERWTVFPKFAKIYQRKRWAQTMEERLGGHVVQAAASPTEKVNPL
jgi:hypothetical protein